MVEYNSGILFYPQINESICRTIEVKPSLWDKLDKCWFNLFALSNNPQIYLMTLTLMQVVLLDITLPDGTKNKLPALPAWK